MKRRTFLKTIASIGATLAVSPIQGLKAIEKQGVKRVFRNVQAGATLLTPAIIAREALELLKEDIAMSHFLEMPQVRPRKPGDTIKIRRPVKFKL